MIRLRPAHLALLIAALSVAGGWFAYAEDAKAPAPGTPAAAGAATTLQPTAVPAPGGDASATTAAPAAGDAAAAEAAPAEGAGGDEEEGPPKKPLISEKSEKNAQRIPVLLTIGEDKLVDLEFEANVSSANGVIEGNKTVATAQLVRVKGKPKQILFKPLKEGTTTVTVRDEQANVKVIFDLQVTSNDLARMLSELKDLLRDIEGIELRIVGKNIVIDGEVMTPSDYGRLLGVVEEPNSPYKEVVMNLVSFSPIALTALAKRIQNDFKGFAPSVTARVVNGRIWLEGQVENRAQAQRAFAVAELYVPETRPQETIEKFDENAKKLTPKPIIQNFITVNAPPPKKADKLVRLTVNFVELNKDYSRTFGFKWQPGFTQDESITIATQQNGQAGAGSAAGGFTATISNLFPRLQSAQDAGFARILKTGTVLVKNGQVGNVQDQSEFAFSLPGGGGQSGNEKVTTGIAMAVTPKIIGQSDDIDLDLDLSQVNIIGLTPQGAPITSKHAVKTKIFVRSKDSAAVVALNSAEVNTEFNKNDPAPGSFQGQTGPLFSLLRSKAFKKKKTQIVIFVTPQVVENASEGTQDLKKNFRVKVE
jgi:pilus assembly protein CpaC